MIKDMLLFFAFSSGRDYNERKNGHEEERKRMKREQVALWILAGAMILGGCGKKVTVEVPEKIESDVVMTEPEKQDPVETEQVQIEVLTADEMYTTQAEDGTVLLASVLHYPKIRILNAPEAEEKINQIFAAVREADDSQLEEYESWAMGHYQQVQESGEGFFTEYAMDREYAVTYQSDRLLSIRGFMYIYTGGAHPGTVIQTWNLDLETGEDKKLMELAEEPERLQEFLNEWIQSELESREIEEGISLVEGLFPDYQEILAQSLQEPVWYVREGNLWIVFNEYEIAPYAAGVIEVAIPLEELQEYWNEAGQQLLEEKQ